MFDSQPNSTYRCVSLVRVGLLVGMVLLLSGCPVHQKPGSGTQFTLKEAQTGKTFYCGGGRIAEMKVVTHTGSTKQEDGGLWTPTEIAEAMKPGEILLPD